MKRAFLLGSLLILSAFIAVPTAAAERDLQTGDETVRLTVGASMGLPELAGLQGGVLLFDRVSLEARIAYFPMMSVGFGGSVTGFVPGSGGDGVPRHALVLSLDAMRNPALGWESSTYEGMGFYAEGLTGYTFTATNGLQARLTGGVMRSGKGDFNPAVRLGAGWVF